MELNKKDCKNRNKECNIYTLLECECNIEDVTYNNFDNHEILYGNSPVITCENYIEEDEQYNKIFSKIEEFIGFYDDPNSALKPCVKIKAKEYTDAKNQFVKYLLEKHNINTIENIYIININHLVYI